MITFDITSELKRLIGQYYTIEEYVKNSFLFNPSVAYLDSNILMISCRIFKRSDGESNNRDLLWNSQHPWYTGPGNEWFWETDDGGYDGTYVGVFRLNPTSLELLSNILTIEGADLRIYKDTEDNFIFTYNSVITKGKVADRIHTRLKDEPEYSKCQIHHGKVPDISLIEQFCTPENRCFIIEQTTVHLDKSIDPARPYLLNNIEKVEGLCINLSDRVEKNWSYFKSNNKNYILYSIENNIEIYEYNDDPMNCNCTTIKNSPSSEFFKKLSKYYRNVPDRKLFYTSLSTPAYPFKNLQNTYLSVGHYKIDRSYLRNNDTPYKNFYKKNMNESTIMHPTYIYFMFFFEFTIVNSDIPFVINRISPAFMIKEPNYSLQFPSGLTNVDNNWYLSYGVADAECRITEFNQTEIDDLLKPIEQYTVEDYPFIMLETN